MESTNGVRHCGDGLQRITALGTMTLLIIFVLYAGIAVAGQAANDAAMLAQVRPTDQFVGGDGDGPEAVEEVLVTGSRIKRSQYDLPAPVMVLDAELIEASALVSVSDILLRNPAIAVGVGPQNVANSGLVGANFTNLRGLGIDRSLTLVNGRRRVPGDTTSTAVDLGTVSPAMIESIEILTGGTSAVYGADAVTGVVNVILKDDFQGYEIRGQAGLPEQGGGGDSQQFSIVGGRNFAAGRGNFMFGVSYDESDFLDGLDRDFARGLRVAQFRPNMANTGLGDGIPDSIVVRDVVTANFPNTGAFFFFNGNVPFDATPGPGEPLRFNWFTADPQLRPLRNDFAQCFTSGCFFDVRAQGGDGFRFENFNTLRAGFERVAGLAKIHYDLGDKASLYGQIDISESEGVSRFQAPFHPASNTAIQLTRDNPLLDPTVTAFMDENGLGSIFVNRTHADIGRRTNSSERRTASAVAGIEGTLGERWEYDVFYQYGRTDVDFISSNTVFTERLLQAFDAVSDATTGQPVCRDMAARAAGCLPLRALGPENEITDPTFRNWLYHEPISRSMVEQQLFGSQVSANLVELPAGPLAIAAGIEYRREEIRFRDDPTRDLLLLNNSNPPEDGSLSVKEAFGEFVVPIAADRPLLDLLQFEGAFRYSDYDQDFGSTWAWKAGGSWSPIQDLRFRVTLSKSVRAPSITDLFTPGATVFVFPNDPCSAENINNQPNRVSNCAALGIPVGFMDPAILLKPQLTGGNPLLEPEPSDSWTAGFVVSPRAWPNFRIAVDFWEIELTGAIGNLPFQDIINGCVDSETINNVFCPLVGRDPGNFEISEIRNVFINIGGLKAAGTDFQLNYSGALADHFFGDLPGDFAINVAGTYLEENNQLVDANDPDSLLIFAGETGLPKWRLNINARYTHDRLSANWFINYLDSTVADNQAASDETFPAGFDQISSRTYHNLAFDYRVNDSLSVNAGANNVFDKEPPNHPFVSLGGGGLYDNQGRFYFLGARWNFQ